MPRDGKVDPYQDLYNRLSRAAHYAVDTETNGLDWREHHVVGYVFTFSKSPEDSLYYPIRHAEGVNLDPARLADVIRTGIKANPGARKIFHNAKFDLHMMTNEGIVGLSNLEDTSVNESLLFAETARSFSLESCCERNGATPKKGEALYAHIAGLFGGESGRDQMGQFWRLSAQDELGVDYAIGDGISTLDLWERQSERLDAEDLRTVWAVECRCIPAVFHMERVGVRIDETRVAQVTGIVDRALEKAYAVLPKKGPDGKDFNSRAPSHMKSYFTDQGMKDQWPISAKGNASFAAPWLETNEPGQRIIAVRKYEQFKSTFLVPLKERHLYKGRVHTTFQQEKSDEGGTITGRFASHDPNMQAANKRDKSRGAIHRSMFIPDEGRVWRSSDLRQVEPKLMIHYSGAKALMEAYRTDPDTNAHKLVAEMIGESDYDAAKRFNQALITGAGRVKTAEMLGMSMAAADELRDKYFRWLPEIPQIQKRMKERMERRGYILTVLGRRIRLVDRRFSYKAFNGALQGSNADIIKKAMADCWDEFGDKRGLDMLLTIHDSLDLQFHPDFQREADRMNEIMCDFGPGRSVELRVPMAVDSNDGRDWAEATYGAGTVEKVFASHGEKWR